MGENMMERRKRWTDVVEREYKRGTPSSLRDAVMAVADAEQAELRGQVARVEALHDKWAVARNVSDGLPNPLLIGISAILRAALDGDAGGIEISKDDPVFGGQFSEDIAHRAAMHD